MTIGYILKQTIRICLSFLLCFMDPCTAAHEVMETATAVVVLVPVVYEGIVIAWTAAASGAAAVGGTAGAGAGTAAAGSLGPILIGAAVGVVVIAAIGGIAYAIHSSKKKNKVNLSYKDEDKNRVKWGAVKLSKSEKKKMLSRKGNISITCYHVSCRSDHPKVSQSWNAIGFVLYSYNGKQQWTMNNVRCRSGYIVLISSDKVLKKKQNGKTMHNTAFKMIFGKYPSELRRALIAGGFSVQKGQCVFNSASFNKGFAKRDTVHFGTRVMNPLEQKYIACATKNWIDHKQQNTDVSTVAKNGGDLLCIHPDFVKTKKGKK